MMTNILEGGSSTRSELSGNRSSESSKLHDVELCHCPRQSPAPAVEQPKHIAIVTALVLDVGNAIYDAITEAHLQIPQHSRLDLLSKTSLA